MNKQELLEQVNGLPSTLLDKRVLVDKSAVLELVNQLDEPKKVVIPRFVAEWIEYCKKGDLSILFALSVDCSINQEVYTWVKYKECQEIFARAWLDGYEVEKEKLYTVKLPNPHSDNPCYLHRSGKIIKIVITQFKDWKKRSYNQLTEAEIKKDFEWAWDAGFAKEVE